MKYFPTVNKREKFLTLFTFLHLLTGLPMNINYFSINSEGNLYFEEKDHKNVRKNSEDSEVSSWAKKICN